MLDLIAHCLSENLEELFHFFVESPKIKKMFSEKTPTSANKGQQTVTDVLGVHLPFGI